MVVDGRTTSPTPWGHPIPALRNHHDLPCCVGVAPRPPGLTRHGHSAARRSPTMRLANVNDRAALVLGEEIADVAEASGGRFGPGLMGIYDDWGAFLDFAGGVTSGTGPLVEGDLRCPVPVPRQVF